MDAFEPTEGKEIGHRERPSIQINSPGQNWIVERDYIEVNIHFGTNTEDVRPSNIRQLVESAVEGARGTDPDFARK